MKKSVFDHTFVNNGTRKTLFLLHGTGGTKDDFLFLDELLQHTYNLVGVQGNVKEGGVTRFFKPVKDGVFDQDSIKDEASKFNDFVSGWLTEHDLTAEDAYFLGYSNGANMILATSFYYPGLFKHAVLLHARLPFSPKKKVDLSGAEIFASMGENDEWVNTEQQQELVHELEKVGAKVTHQNYEHGHQLSKEEFRDVIEFLKKE